MIKANEEMKENAGRTSVLAMEFMYKELGHAHIFAEGEPVWVEIIGADRDWKNWEIVGAYSWEKDRDIISMCNLSDGNYDVYADLYGKTWLAYRRKL